MNGYQERKEAARSRTSKVRDASKGKGAKPGPAKLRERIIRTAGIKLVATGSKGRTFDLRTLIAGLEEALDLLRAEAVVGQGDDPNAP